MLTIMVEEEKTDHGIFKDFNVKRSESQPDGALTNLFIKGHGAFIL